jgi:type IV pilus assembly protein PilC
MLREYRYQGVTLGGKGVQGIVLAHNKGRAKKLVESIAPPKER